MKGEQIRFGGSAKTNVPEISTFLCVDCGMAATSSFLLESHLNTEEHWERVKQVKLEDKELRGVVLWCDVCGVKVRQGKMGVHKKGGLHVAMLQKSAVQEDCTTVGGKLSKPEEKEDNPDDKSAKSKLRMSPVPSTTTLPGLKEDRTLSTNTLTEILKTTYSKERKHLLPFSGLFEMAAKPQISNSKKWKKRKRNGKQEKKVSICSTTVYTKEGLQNFLRSCGSKRKSTKGLSSSATSSIALKGFSLLRKLTVSELPQKKKSQIGKVVKITEYKSQQDQASALLRDMDAKEESSINPNDLVPGCNVVNVDLEEIGKDISTIVSKPQIESTGDVLQGEIENETDEIISLEVNNSDLFVQKNLEECKQVVWKYEAVVERPGFNVFVKEEVPNIINDKIKTSIEDDTEDGVIGNTKNHGTQESWPMESTTHLEFNKQSLANAPSAQFVIISLDFPAGTKALLHCDRLWLADQVLSVWKGLTEQVVTVNARRVEGFEEFDYQVIVIKVAVIFLRLMVS